MATLSPALLLTWDIAANEAAYAKQSLIEPEHLFIGLCKLEDFSTTTALIDLGYDQAEANLVRPDIEAISTLFYRFGLGPAQLRRDLRQNKRSTGVLTRLNNVAADLLRPPPSSAQSESTVIHRSAASRAVFVRADELALASSAALTAPTHLLAALLEDSSSPLVNWLRQYVDVEAFKQAALEMLSPQRRG
jgi:hypothetical protein